MAQGDPIKGYQNKEDYIKKANEVEIKYNLPRNMLVGVMATESNFNPRAKSSVGASGLMQFMPATAKDFGIDPYNTDQAIDAAGKYLSRNYKQLGNWDDTLRSYNMGLGNVNKWKAGKMKLPRETAEYTGKVYKNMGIKQSISPSNNNTIYTEPQEATTTHLTNFDIPINNSNFVSVPDSPKEEGKTEKKEESESLSKLKEDSFLKDYKSLYSQQEIPQQEQQNPPIEKSNLQNIFNQVSNFIDTPIVAQSGGTITTKQDRSWYNPRLDRIELGTDYNGWVKNAGEQEELIAHENYHRKQHNESRDNFDIANNTDYRLDAEMQKRPELPSTDSVWGTFYNRKMIENDFDVNRLADKIPENKFFKNAFYDLAIDKKIDDEQYSDPTTLEGEAMFFQKTGKEYHKLQSGGQIIKDNNGYLDPKNWGRTVQIDSNRITMKGVNQNLMGYSPETGERKLMTPGNEYIFKGAKRVIETPIKQNEIDFLNSLK